MRTHGNFWTRGDKKPCDPPAPPGQAVKTRVQRGHASLPCFTSRAFASLGVGIYAREKLDVLHYETLALNFFLHGANGLLVRAIHDFSCFFWGCVFFFAIFHFILLTLLCRHIATVPSRGVTGGPFSYRFLRPL